LLLLLLRVAGGHVRLEGWCCHLCMLCGVFHEKRYQLYSLEIGVAGLRPSRLSL
jgi:hypothetical protein